MQVWKYLRYIYWNKNSISHKTWILREIFSLCFMDPCSLTLSNQMIMWCISVSMTDPPGQAHIEQTPKGYAVKGQEVKLTCDVGSDTGKLRSVCLLRYEVFLWHCLLDNNDSFLELLHCNAIPGTRTWHITFYRNRADLYIIAQIHILRFLVHFNFTKEYDPTSST